MSRQSTDELVAGSIVGGIVTALFVVLLVYLDFPPERRFDVFTRLAVPALLAACVLFPRPLLLRTVLRTRRHPMLLDGDLNLTLAGRALGLIGGLLIGSALATGILQPASAPCLALSARRLTGTACRPPARRRPYPRRPRTVRGNCARRIAGSGTADPGPRS